MAQRVARSAVLKRLYSASAKPNTQQLSPAGVQVGKASNGIRVVAEETGSPIARVVCAVKAGSRYEDASQRGITHTLRCTTDLTQREARAYGMTRDLQQMGANVSCSNSRENLMYTLEVPRDNVEAALPYLAGMVANQSFRPWEISECMPRIEYELMSLAEQPDKRIVEKLHEAAYRESGLGRSLYAPLFQLSEMTPDKLREYVNTYFAPERVSLSGMGVDYGVLMGAASSFEVRQPGKAMEKASQYYGGEIREASEDLLAYTMIAGEGASLSGADLWAFAVLEQLLGAGPQIKWASNTTSNKLNAAVQQKTDLPFAAQAFNVNYSDSGLFGVSVVSVPENSSLVMKTVFSALRDLATKPLNDQEVQGAKNRVKSCIAFQSECASDVVEARALELLRTSQLSDLTQTMQAVDAISSADVQKAAKKVISSNLSMSSVGEIFNVPYKDQL